MVKAKLIYASQSRDVELRDEAEHLTLYDLRTGELLERWPWVALEEVGNREPVILSWPPNPSQIQILTPRKKIPWAKKLPSDAHRPKIKSAAIWLALVAVLVGIIAVTVPYLASLVPWRWEEKLAKQTALFSVESTCRNPKGRELLSRLVQRIYPLNADDKKFSIEVEAVNKKEVNAVAFLGGKIYVYEGLLKEAGSAEEVAGVLAHEIEHAKRRHVLQGLIRQSFFAVTFYALSGGDSKLDPSIFENLLHLQFGRGQEAEADEEGLKRLNAAHVSTEGFKKFFSKRKSSRFEFILSDHPSDTSRAAMAEKYPDHDARPILQDSEWPQLKSICDK